MYRLRLGSQITFFVIFLFLFLKTTYSGEPYINAAVRFFLELDPFIALVIILEEKGIPSGLTQLFVFSGILFALTLLLGRFFCGWICPFGTVNHFFGYRKKLTKKRIKNSIYSPSQKIKYIILSVLLISALFSLNVAGVFDPISLLIRSLTITVLPSFHLFEEEFSTIILNLDWPVITPVSEFVYTNLKKSVLPYNVQYFMQNIFIGLIFISILALNRIRPRFWCRFICPFGALLAVGSTTSRIQRKLGDSCNECNICHATCQGAPAKEGAKNWNPQECFLCFNCQKVCPEKAISFHVKKSQKEISPSLSTLLPSRRAFLASTAASLAVVPVIHAAPHKKLSNPKLIRPPGSLPENDFINRCVRCGECMKVCPANGLQPTLLEAGLEGIWSPMFNMRLGYCEYTCTLCGQVCPTGAIQKLTEQQKKDVKIGLAFIDVSRCLPYAFSISCIVCEEHCPTPDKAIVFEEKEIITHDGLAKTLKFPRVDPLRCIGCGICENKCPVMDKRAIYITSVNETRNEDNQVILEDQTSQYGY